MEPEPDLLLSTIYFSHHLFLLITGLADILVLLIIFVLLLISSAYISGSEVAFFSLDERNLEELKEHEDKKSQRVLQLLTNHRKLLATILITNNIVNIAIVLVSEMILIKLLSGSTIDNWSEHIVSTFSLNEGIVSSLSITIDIIIKVGLVTVILVLFGEVMPKAHGQTHSMRVSKTMSGPLTLLNRLFSPLSNLLVTQTNAIEKKLVSTKDQHFSESSEDLDKAIDLTIKSGVGSKEQIGFYKRIIKFSEVSVNQIMKSRTDIVAIDMDSNFTELLDLIKKTGFSRIPAYKEHLDNIQGILYVKDLIGYHDKGEKFKWQKLVRDNILYIPDSKMISDLLNEFREERKHMAIIVDEYGGTQGLVTLEDILEEVVGEIIDEFDYDEIEYEKINDYTYIFDGKTLINDVCKITGIPDDDMEEFSENADTIAGMILEKTGLFPKVNSIHRFNKYIFKVKRVSSRRIVSIEIILPKKV